MKPRLVGENITLQNQLESNEEVPRKIRYLQITEILEDSKEPLSAKEIAVEMFKRGYASTSERNLSHPRLTELCKMGVVDAVGSKVCEYTSHNVTTYALRYSNV